MVNSGLTIRSIILSQTSSINRKALIKASITWDHPCCPIHRKYYSYACVFLDNRRDYNIAIDFLFPCHLWDMHLGSYC
jgi:hypothetical protein